MSYTLSGTGETVTFQSIAQKLIAKILSIGVPGFRLDHLIPDGPIQNTAVNLVANLLANQASSAMDLKSGNTDAMGFAIANALGELGARNGFVFNTEEGDNFCIYGMWWNVLIGTEDMPGSVSIEIANALESILDEIGIEATPTDTDVKDDWDTDTATGKKYTISEFGTKKYTVVTTPKKKIVGFKTTPVKAGGSMLPIALAAGAAALILMKRK